MSILFSRTQNAFYDTDINPVESLPADVVEISAAQHSELLAGQSAGKIICSNIEGYPILTDPAEPSHYEKQQAAWKRIKAERDRRTLEGGIPAGGKWFHSDVISRTQQLGMMIMEAIPEGLLWKTMDGTMIGMTKELSQEIFLNAVNQDRSVFAAAEAHRFAMLNTADPLTYDFSSGWPVSFLDQPQ